MRELNEKDDPKIWKAFGLVEQWSYRASLGRPGDNVRFAIMGVEVDESKGIMPKVLEKDYKKTTTKTIKSSQLIATQSDAYKSGVKEKILSSIVKPVSVVMVDKKYYIVDDHHTFVSRVALDVNIIRCDVYTRK